MRIRAPRQVTLVRACGWAFFVLLATIRMAVPFMSLSPGGAQVVGDFTIYLLPILLSIVGAALLTLASTTIEHRFWGLLAAASGLILTAEVYWTWYAAVINPRGPPIPAPYELLLVAAAMLFFGVVVTMTTFGSAPVVARVRFYVDVAAAAVVVHTIGYWFWVGPLFSGVPGNAWMIAAVSSVYPIVGGLMLIATGVVIFGRGSHRLHGWERLVGAAMTIFSISLCTMPWAYAALLDSSGPMPSMYVTVGLGFGYYLLFMATVYRWTAGTSAAVLEPWPVPKAHPRWLPALYPIVLACILPFLGMWAIAVADTPMGPPIVAASIGLAVLLVVRSWLLGLERSFHRAVAITDPASGAYSHRYLHERLSAQMAHASAIGAVLAVGVLDVEEFSLRGETTEHSCVDSACVTIARILAEEGGPDVAVYRLGGGEFAFVAADAGADEAMDVARRSAARISREVESDGGAVSVSAGIAVYPEHASDSEEIVAHAIAAQQLAGASDDSRVVVYDEAVVGASDPLERLARARRHSRQATVKALAAAVDARDSDTRHHSQNVADLATALALVLDLSEETTHLIELAAQMHDVGKLGVSDEVLLKQEPLTPDDRAHIEEHPVLGERILAAARLDDILPAVRSHHERWDGTGYPDGLSGYDIPLVARMLSVCDAFEAMTSVRRNRNTLTVPRAIAELERCAGTQFDPDIALVFARMVGRLHGQALRDTFSTP